jgi:branched-chain amino acid transport system permease protein
VTVAQSESSAPRTSGARLADLNELWIVRALFGSSLVSILLVALVVGLYETGSGTTQTVVLIFLYNLLVVLGLQVFTSNSGVISFGHVAFMGIAAYVTALLSTDPTSKASQIPNAPGFIRHAHLGFFTSTLVAIAVTAALAIPSGFIFARLSGAAAAIVTLSWLLVVQTVLANWDSVTHGTFTFYGIPPSTTVWWGLGWAVVAVFVARLFRESGLGLALRATSADSLVARAVGVNLLRARLFSWVLSAALAAVAGVLYAHFITALAPTIFGFDLTFPLLVMVIVGGRSVSGAVIGAASIAFIQEALRRIENNTGHQGISTLALAVIFLLVMIVRSEGLLGRWELDELLVRGARNLRGRSRTPASAEAPPPPKGGRGRES